MMFRSLLVNQCTNVIVKMTSIIKLKIDIITTDVAAEILNNLVTKSHSYNDDKEI